MSKWMRKAAGLLALAALALAVRLPGQEGHHDFPAVPLPEKTGPLRKALLLLREGKTAEARKDLEEQRKLHPDDPDVLFQIARSYLLDFYKEQQPERRRIALGLAMEHLDATLKKN